jgi:hypothetical protein
MLIAKLIWDLQASIVDFKTSFLRGDLQEEIYMKVPDDLQQDLNFCYGLVQSSGKLYNTLLSMLKSMGFTKNKSDS